MSLRIRYACPYCTRRIVHHADLSGHLVICSACKGEFYEPTDPLPGKPAQKALEPRTTAPRRLRVPEGDNPRHDLAILARRDGSDHRTITEIVEAVLLDGEPLPTPDDLPRLAPEEPSLVAPKPSETIPDFGYVQQGPPGRAVPAIPAWQPPGKSRLYKPSPALPAAPVAKSTPHANAPPAAKPGDSDHSLDYEPAPSPVPPTLAGPAVRSLVSPTATGNNAVVAVPLGQRSVPKPGVPGSTVGAGKPAAPPLAGASIKQMVEELRRRGLGVTMITCDMAPMRNFELAFSDNMTREDSLALLRKYLESLRTFQPKPTRSGMLKRMWKTDDE